MNKTIKPKVTNRRVVEFIHEHGQQPGAYYRCIHTGQLYFRMQITQGGKEINRWHTATRDGEPNCPIRIGLKFYKLLKRKIVRIFEVQEVTDKVTSTGSITRSTKPTIPEVLCELARLLPLVSTANVAKLAHMVSCEQSNRLRTNNFIKP